MGGVGEWEWKMWVRVGVCRQGSIVHVCVFAHVYMCVFAHVYMCVCLRMYTCVFAHVYMCVFVHVYMCVFVHVCAYHCLDVLGTLCIFESVAGLLKGRARWADVCNHGSAAVAAKGVLRMMGEEESRECDRDSKHSELNYFVQTATEGGNGSILIDGICTWNTKVMQLGVGRTEWVTIRKVED